MRIFLKAPGTDSGKGLEASVEALKPLADEAAKKLTIAIEPGASELSERCFLKCRLRLTIRSQTDARL